MTLFLDGHAFGYEMRRLCSMFCFGDEIKTVDGTPPENCQDAYLCIRKDGTALAVFGCLSDGKTYRKASFLPEDAPPALAEHCLGQLLYDILEEHTGLRPPWGVLTGVRPVKLLLRKYEEAQGRPDFDDAQWKRHMIADYRMDASRLSLAFQTAENQRAARLRNTPDSVSLYISIPYCPTRCAYCSFVSHSVEKAARDIPAYLDCLCEELLQTAKLVKELGLRLRTVYFGGGTPTTLTAPQLARLMELIAKNYDLSQMWEYTVEAGRPDTVTREKLRTLREYGVNRVSINPQTMSDEILRRIGRAHTARQTREAYEMARREGFSCINMDLIAGLPGDTQEGFAQSVREVLAMAPENVTVHTLTVKRAARVDYSQAREELQYVDGMVRFSREAICQTGRLPYYLYRQSGTLAALENVGYALTGTQGLYNIYMMEEWHSVFAVGAGASTKLCSPDGTRIKRVYNYKYPYEYISRFETVKERKAQIAAFYENEKYNKEVL